MTYSAVLSLSWLTLLENWCFELERKVANAPTSFSARSKLSSPWTTCVSAFAPAEFCCAVWVLDWEADSTCFVEEDAAGF